MVGLVQPGELFRLGAPNFGAVTVQVTNAQVLALNATPITIINAMGVGTAIIPYLFEVRHNGGTAYGGIAAGEDLVLKYTNGSGAICASAMETTGFLDQTTPQMRVCHGNGAVTSTPADITPVENSPVVLHLLSGEITTGNFPLFVRVRYFLIGTTFTA